MKIMNNPIGTWTFFKRETHRFVKVYMQTLVAPVISNLLFLTVFGLSLSRSIESIGGLSYLEFIVPGLVMMGIINNAFQNPSSSIMITKYQGRIGQLMTIPLTAGEILFGFISSAVLRGLLVGLITYLTAIIFVDFTYPAISILLTAAVLVSLAFSFLGLLVGIWADEFDKQAFITNFIITPLTFLGGVFYSVATLPEFFANLSSYNPIVYMINLIRYGFTGLLEFPLLNSFLVLGLGTFLLGAACYWALKTGWRLQD